MHVCLFYANCGIRIVYIHHVTCMYVCSTLVEAYCNEFYNDLLRVAGRFARKTCGHLGKVSTIAECWDHDLLLSAAEIWQLFVGQLDFPSMSNLGEAFEAIGLTTARSYDHTITVVSIEPDTIVAPLGDISTE